MAAHSFLDFEPSAGIVILLILKSLCTLTALLGSIWGMVPSHNVTLLKRKDIYSNLLWSLTQEKLWIVKEIMLGIIGECIRQNSSVLVEEDLCDTFRRKILLFFFF
jgi:hypothetical protein